MRKALLTTALTLTAGLALPAPAGATDAVALCGPQECETTDLPAGTAAGAHTLARSVCGIALQDGLEPSALPVAACQSGGPESVLITGVAGIALGTQSNDGDSFITFGLP